MIKYIVSILLFSTTGLCAEIIEPGTPLTVTYDITKELAFSDERKLVNVVVNGASAVSDCYNFEGLLEDPTDLFEAMRAQFGPNRGLENSTDSGEASNEGSEAEASN